LVRSRLRDHLTPEPAVEIGLARSPYSAGHRDVLSLREAFVPARPPWQGYPVPCRARRTSLDPCLPRPAKELPAGRDCIHEIKHDGFRLLARREGDRVPLVTRNDYDFTVRYPKIVAAVESLPIDTCLIDGEAIVVDERGAAVFDALRYRLCDHAAALCAFDLVELDGADVRWRPLEHRKAMLADLLRGVPDGIRVNPAFAEAWYNLADLLDDQGRSEAAVECLRKALVIAPDYMMRCSIWHCCCSEQVPTPKPLTIGADTWQAITLLNGLHEPDGRSSFARSKLTRSPVFMDPKPIRTKQPNNKHLFRLEHFRRHQGSGVAVRSKWLR